MEVETVARDPEILKLSREIHKLTGQIEVLVTEINKASVLLVARAESVSNEGTE